MDTALMIGWILVAGTTATVLEEARPGLLARGRIFSRWMRRFPGFRRFDPMAFRIVQYMSLSLALSVVAAPYVTDREGAAISALMFIALFVDDYLTGDDDRWRRYRAAARNAVRWLMELPRPAQPDVA